MKTVSFLLLLLFVCAVFNGCLKDVKLKKYTYYTPVISLKKDVRDAVKSSAPQNIVMPGKIYVQGNYIYINELGKGIHIVDYSQPSAPQNISFIPIPGSENLTIKGNYLYADEYADLLTIDITNPANAKLVTVSPNAFYDSYSSYVDSAHIITSWRRVDTTVKGTIEVNRYTVPIYLFDDANFYPSASGAQSNNISVGGSMARFTTVNNRLYTIYNSDINVFNIDKPQTPSFVQKTATSIGEIETMYPFENNLFLGSNSGMFIYNIDNADNPTYAGSFYHIRTCDPVIAEHDKAYVTLRSGTVCAGFTNELDVLNTTNISNPVAIKTYPFTNPRGLAKEGNNLFICDGADGLKILDAANVTNITLLKTVSGFEANDVILNNGLAIVIAAEGLYLVDYSNINNAHVVSKIEIVKQ